MKALLLYLVQILFLDNVEIYLLVHLYFHSITHSVINYDSLPFYLSFSAVLISRYIVKTFHSFTHSVISLSLKAIHSPILLSKFNSCWNISIRSSVQMLNLIPAILISIVFKAFSSFIIIFYSNAGCSFCYSFIN